MSNPPPIGNSKHANRYIDKLIQLMKYGKIALTHSDLKKYDPTTIQDHYRISFGDYDAEVSHSINPNNNQNIYILIFTNTAHIQSGQADKVILSYLYLSEELFHKFKSSAEDYFERQRLEAEERRFQETMKPIDDIIQSSISQSDKDDLKNDLKSDFLSSHETATIIH